MLYHKSARYLSISDLTPFIAVATILLSVRKSLKRSQIEVPHGVCV